MSNESESEQTKDTQREWIHENRRLRDKLRAIREALWHHCLLDESENQLMMRAYPNGPTTVPAFLVNAQLIDEIHQMTHIDTERVVLNQYPKPLN
jgi:hypothetical protein